VFGADFIGHNTEWFAGASFHFTETALDAAHGIHQIVRALTTRFQHANIFADGMLFRFMQSRLHAFKNEFTRKQSQMGIRQSLSHGVAGESSPR
jgi:hypothetical protein